MDCIQHQCPHAGEYCAETSPHLRRWVVAGDVLYLAASVSWQRCLVTLSNYWHVRLHLLLLCRCLLHINTESNMCECNRLLLKHDANASIFCCACRAPFKSTSGCDNFTMMRSRTGTRQCVECEQLHFWLCAQVAPMKYITISTCTECLQSGAHGVNIVAGHRYHANHAASSPADCQHTPHTVLRARRNDALRALVLTRMNDCLGSCNDQHVRERRSTSMPREKRVHLLRRVWKIMAFAHCVS